MIITRSSALKTFKKEAGQANHMLITILVGLDGIIDGNVTINKEFHAAWNPKDRDISARRSKDFAKKSCLVWMVDCIDMYVRLINKSPSIIGGVNLKHRIDSEENSRSIYKKLKIICEEYGIDNICSALVDLLICWRNRLTHFDAYNDISIHNREILLNNKEVIKAKYRGLDIELMLGSFDNNQPPKFKEVASLISASIDLVYTIDDVLIKNVDTILYADQVILKHLKVDVSKRLNEIFSNENEKINKSLRQILMQDGFTIDVNDENGVDSFCIGLSMLDFDEIKTRYNAGSFIK